MSLRRGSNRAGPALAWLLLCLVQAALVGAQNAVSTIFIRESETQFSVNLVPDSDDVNFFIAASDWYQYIAIGFGSTMADSLMLVAYPAADYTHITISPRTSWGHTEPTLYEGAFLTIHDGSLIRNNTMYINGTCHRCREWPSGSIDVASVAQPMIFALGPGLLPGSDDPAAQLRRHIGYGHFTMDMVKATGIGGIGTPQNITNGAVLLGGIAGDHDKAATAHGIIFAIATLAVAPFDTLVAGIRRWPTLHMITSTIYFALVIGAFIPGIIVSTEYVMTKKFDSAHQVLGLITIILMISMMIWGIILSVVRNGAKKRGQEPPERSQLMGTIHTWIGRLIWLLFLINNGVGLKLANQTTIFILGYSVLAAGIVIFMLPVYWCVWRFTQPRQHQQPKEEDGHQLHSIYNHGHQ
ncbi:hypothetical protein B0T17DRAFT_299328 [Bombardia bombarda]|uniref:Cellobiose dehydrogenase-like cytochrome domain-containing protein n=1 Tax=Bombardia bombarda TaxID=252184 RepID=A0AA39WU46_9PEZI|nr:hypothetical protein B0T17DRAFT_299328 [Bombardia bombarda]